MGIGVKPPVAQAGVMILSISCSIVPLPTIFSRSLYLCSYNKGGTMNDNKHNCEGLHVRTPQRLEMCVHSVTPIQSGGQQRALRQLFSAQLLCQGIRDTHDRILS